MPPTDPPDERWHALGHVFRIFTVFWLLVALIAFAVSRLADAAVAGQVALGAFGLAWLFLMAGLMAAILGLRRSRRRRRLIIVVAVIVVLVVGVATALWVSFGPPTASAFYESPAGIDRDQPGQILRTEAIAGAPSGVRLWRMLYTSTDLAGRSVAVSALVAVPRAPAPAGGYPALSVAHGTVGINRGCAPSIAPFAKVDADHDAYQFLVGQYVAAGYAVVMSDFEGLGVPGKSSYLVGEIEGHDVLDAARALRAFPGVPTRPGVLVAGQSQGGHAALWAGQLASTYAPDLDVIGVVAQAPATDLGEMFGQVLRADKRGGVVSLTVMAADAYTQQYAGVRLGQVLTRRGEGALHTVVRRLCLIPAILGTQLARPSDLVRPDGLAVLGPDVERNSPGARFAVPVLIAQGESDQVVRPAVTAAYAARLCAAGTALTLDTYLGKGHFDVVDASTPDVLTWMAAVRAGTPPRSTCPG